MSNLREEARQAAWNITSVIPTDDIADAVSDVWEPIVRAFLDSSLVKYHGKPFYGRQMECPACTMGHDCYFKNAITAAKEALGDS